MKKFSGLEMKELIRKPAFSDDELRSILNWYQDLIDFFSPNNKRLTQSLIQEHYNFQLMARARGWRE